MAIAEEIYVDPSALLKLHVKEPESRAMTKWRARIGGSLLVTHHGRVELINAIGLAACHGVITDEIHEAALAALDNVLAKGRYRQADLLWRATLQTAAELSRQYARRLGSRSLDVLHVASALELERKSFVTSTCGSRDWRRAPDSRLSFHKHRSCARNQNFTRASTPSVRG